MRYFFFFLFSVSLFSCNQDAKEFKTFSNAISYKYIQLGDNKAVEENEVLELTLMVLGETEDTLHFVHDFHYFLEPKVHPIDSVFRKFKVGDSVLIKIDRSLFNDFFKFYKVLQSDEGAVLLSLRVVNSLTTAEAEKAKKIAISKRELDEQAALQVYLNELGADYDTLDGVYRQILHENDSTPIQFGSHVSIQYKGYFLDGYVFDDTQEKSITPTFTFGQEYQMIEGFKTALSGRKEGERVKIILPSRLAFGEEGSLAGIVPPYTAVIYDVNIIKVIN
jgi:FKBP-type peptidyl-prolyl cis-trans isomerase FkpA